MRLQTGAVASPLRKGKHVRGSRGQPGVSEEGGHPEILLVIYQNMQFLT